MHLPSSQLFINHLFFIVLLFLRFISFIIGLFIFILFFLYFFIKSTLGNSRLTNSWLMLRSSWTNRRWLNLLLLLFLSFLKSIAKDLFNVLTWLFLIKLLQYLIFNLIYVSLLLFFSFGCLSWYSCNSRVFCKLITCYRLSPPWKFIFFYFEWPNLRILWLIVRRGLLISGVGVKLFERVFGFLPLIAPFLFLVLICSIRRTIIRSIIKSLL